MPIQAGDYVLILSGGYNALTAEGLHNGATAVVRKQPNETGGVYLTGLPGTPASINYPDGLYFLGSEYEPTILEQKEMKSYEWEGKYFRDDNGWVIGPMVNESGVAKCGGRYYRPDLTSMSLYDYPDLVPTPIDLGEPVVDNTVRIGDCVLFRGRFWWVTRKDSYDDFLVTHDNTLWVDRASQAGYTTYPSLRIEPDAAVKDLIGKWVWSNAQEDYVQVTEFTSDFKYPALGFNGGLRVCYPGHNYSMNVDMDTLDLSKVLDKHPHEATMVRGIQGEGPYLYAVSRLDPLDRVYVFPRGGYDYGFYNLDKRDWFGYTLSQTNNIWWSYQVFATDTPPDFGLPFSWEDTAKALESIFDIGYSELQRWLSNNAPEGVNAAILRRAKMASNTRGNIALYLTEKQVETQKIQSLRPGKALRVLMPNLTDAELEKLVDKFRRDFPTGDYVVKRGFEAADFKRAYSGAITTMQNPQTSYARKSLSNSCMRHDFSHHKHHPAEAYASGEFEMLWTETPDGKIGSRMVVWHPPEGHRKHGIPQCGPVYGTCEYSMDLLQNLMAEAGAALFNEATWVGAKLQRLNRGHDTVFLPFIDNEQGLEVHDGYLEICDEDPDDCDCAANNTSGYAHVNGGCKCSNCGHRMDEDEAYDTPDGDMCESCYCDNYFSCDEYHETHPVEEANTVYYSTRYGIGERLVCEDARDNNYTLCTNGEWWYSGDVLFLANGDALSPRDRDEAYLCIKTEVYYLLADVLFTVDGEAVSKDYYDGHKDEFTMNADGELEEVKEAA